MLFPYVSIYMIFFTFVCVGRNPVTPDLKLENAGVEINESSLKILVNDHDATNVEHIYAIGDVASVSASEASSGDVSYKCFIG